MHDLAVSATVGLLTRSCLQHNQNTVTNAVCICLQVPYVPEGLEAIIFTADGDMRQALNNLQVFCAFHDSDQLSHLPCCVLPAFNDPRFASS